eukprot:scaffold7207_cov520-Prasinococcus_capsulatus_cf.AAC.10
MPAPVRLRYGEAHPRQWGRLFLPSERPDAAGTSLFPILVLFHGGWWKNKWHLDAGAGDWKVGMESLIECFTMRRVAVFQVEYRLRDDENGGFPGSNEDCLLAVQFVEELSNIYPVDPYNMGLLGHSAGGTLALWVAGELRRRASKVALKVVVAAAACTDLRKAHELRLSDEGDAVLQYMKVAPEDDPELYNEACPSSRLPIGVPQILLVGGKDVDVPPEMNEEYVTRATEAGDRVMLVLRESRDHYEIVGPHLTNSQDDVESLIQAINQITGGSFVPEETQQT